jgi:hypothetical protein
MTAALTTVRFALGASALTVEGVQGFCSFTGALTASHSAVNESGLE